jgi:hypothetical protein
MIALWDGQEARGPGGTAAVIEMALRRGLPVIHLQPGAGSQARILWTGYDPLPVERDSIDEYPWVACDDAALGTLTARMLAPHIDAVERGCLAYYFREDERRNRTRIEYPLLLALTGVRRFSVSSFRTQSYVGASADAWAAWRARLSTLGGGPAAASAELELAYAWSDNLANHFAQTFRSGHLLNFVLAAIAVMLALAGLLWPAAKLGLIVSELAIISMVVLNTSVGRSRQWHRRWLDYRYLAECLRPMRSLKLFGLARAAQRRSTRGTHPGRWPDWYAEALWRQMGCPSGCADARYRERLNELVVAEELQPQIDYHRATAKRMHHLEHRLHGVGNALFAATITACATFVAGYFIAHDWVVLRATAFTAITAALPALGGAIYGIRVHGDFGGSANRSLQTAAELERLARAMSASPAPGFTQAAALAESAARRMLSDLDEWQLTYRQRGLDIPA